MWTRRDLLQRAGAGFGAIALAGVHREAAAAAGLHPAFDHPPLAKRMIFLFMHGGPSHVDTFDYKPRLQQDDGKPLPFAKPRVQFAKDTGNLLRSPWTFKQHGKSGAWVSSLFPHVARKVDDLCFVKSLHGTNVAHGGALLALHTGSDTFVRPSLGSWILYGLGTENRNLPGFVTICPTLGHGGVNNWASAFLPGIYQGTPIGNAGIAAAQATINNLKATTPAALQRAQLDLVRDMNTDHLAARGHDDPLDARIQSYELAFRMQTEAPELMDISGESKETLRLYGVDDKTTENFGRQCLMARRFAEAGVRFVQCTHSYKWDQHSDLKEGHGKNAAEVDKPIAGLLTDLAARGLLEDTLVLWAGEFGRTPVAQGKDGRDHNPHGFTVWMAGGGVKPGISHGATDDYGYYALSDKVHVHDLHATILHILGLNHERLTYRYGGRDFRLTDVSGRVVKEILRV